VDVIDRSIPAKERRPLRVDHPGDLGPGKGVPDENGGWQGMNDVA